MKTRQKIFLNLGLINLIKSNLDSGKNATSPELNCPKGLTELTKKSFDTDFVNVVAKIMEV